jgi:formylglycine-generating enzyme required for sulfatase activity
MKNLTRAVAGMLALTMAMEAGAQSCRSDLNGDGAVNGADLGILLADWGFCPATIDSVTPLQGGTQGGTVISISGTGLSTTSSVRVGGVACTNLNVLTPTLVRATTPPGAVGEASIAVTTAGGTTLASTPFSYVQQQITSIVPNNGPYVGGTPIVISGQFLAGATSVTIGGVPCTNVVSVSATQVTAVTPAGSVGAVDVVVNCPKGAVTVAGGFTYLNYIVPSWATLVEGPPDPAVVTDPALRAAIVATGLAWRVRDTATQIEMLLVPPGTFQMGCMMGSNQYECLGWEEPVHLVTLTNAFYLGRTEVTQADWMARMGANPAHFRTSSDSMARPVETVSWNAIRAPQGFLALTGMRLPTEAEWEYACRAGTQTPFYNGSMDDSTLGALAWYGSCQGCTGNSGGQTHAVGGKAPNALGFYDMLGNVWEWTEDWLGDYSAAAQVNPTGPATGVMKVIRGGAWWDTPEFARSSQRAQDAHPGRQDNGIGFRVARNP